MPIPRALLAALAASAALVVGAPAAGASTLPAWSFPSWFQGTPIAAVNVPVGGAVGGGPCATGTQDGQGRTGGTATEVCQGSGLSYVGPAVGQIATVIGPTIISPSVVIGASVVSAGNVAVAP